MKYKRTKPAYDINKSWDYNYDHGPRFNGSKHLHETVKARWEFFGKKLISPLGIAAGPLPNALWIKAYAELGYGSLTQKTVRSISHHAHPAPNILLVDIKGKLSLNSAEPLVAHPEINKPDHEITITNSFGNPSRAPDVWRKETQKALKTLQAGQILGVNVYGSKFEDMSLDDLADDYGKTAKMAKDAGAEFIEANLACPNVEGFEDPFLYKNKVAVAAVVRAIKTKIGNTPLLLKMGYFDDFDGLIEVLEFAKGYFEGISAINTISRKIVDKKGQMALPRREVSGVCGYAIKPFGIDMAKKLVAARKQLKLTYEIIGVGGVMLPKDVLDYLRVGVNHVHSATAVMWNPYLAQELNLYLKKNTLL